MNDKDKLNILFANDFSLASKIAFNTLNLLQKKYNTDISFIHIIESFWKNWISEGLYQKESLQRLQVWQKKYLNIYDPKKLYVKIDNPADAILNIAHKIKSNLILMGGKIAEKSSRYKTGMTIESVIRSATIPVWICQSNKIKKIICGIDESPSSKKTLKFAIDIAERYSAQLYIIHAIPNYLPAFGMSEKIIKLKEEQFKNEATNKIMKFLTSFDLNHIKHQIICKWGVPANILLDYAEDFNFDLIVIGAKGHSKLYHALLGSTAEKIIRYASCSLLVVR